MGTEVKSSARATWLLVGIVTLAVGGTAYGQMTFESEPIDYEHKSTNDPIARLQKEIDEGRVRLDDERHFRGHARARGRAAEGRGRAPAVLPGEVTIRGGLVTKSRRVHRPATPC